MDVKHTKRVSSELRETPLVVHIANKRACLVASREEVPALRATVAEMHARADAMDARHLWRKKRDLHREADKLSRECDVRESMTREHTFERDVVAYLKTYHAIRARGAMDASHKRESIETYIKLSDAIKTHRRGVVDEYLTSMREAPSKVAMSVRDECPSCDVKLLHCAQKAMMTCPTCGYSVVYLDATSASTSFDEIVEYSQYSYKRVNHYTMWIALVQGKEAHRVPLEICDAVMADLYAQGVRQAADITTRGVRDSLRRLRLRKAYDHVTQITARLSGVRPPQLSVKTEEKLKNMFLQMQPAFQRHAPKSRSNFLSYSYVLYRCFQILNLYDMLDCLVLLKGRDKLEANDTIFRKMCKDLGWPVFDLPLN